MLIFSDNILAETICKTNVGQTEKRSGDLKSLLSTFFSESVMKLVEW